MKRAFNFTYVCARKYFGSSSFAIATHNQSQLTRMEANKRHFGQFVNGDKIDELLNLDIEA